ncbi:hypothetical protein HY989_06035 [Candidatus Micrarchaeota archaeon]|nr:hypothetical protein [Candidatus Micrarchaeota archaeon]
MEIPRPRLKSLLELNEEEKIAEKAVVAIRRKSSQVDSDLGNIRDEVEAELERLDSQRSKLEEAMKQLLEEQSIVLSALADLEDRQITHKQNLELLKNEEEEIDLERKQLNLALRQLKSGQKSIKEMVNRKYSESGKSSLKFSQNRSYIGKNSELEEMLSLRQSRNLGTRSWIAEKQMEEEPAIKIVQKNHFPTRGGATTQANPMAASAPIKIQEQESPVDAPFEPNSFAASIAFQNLATNRNMKKPGMLKRMRLAADKYLPEPFRINKPAIALIEAKLEEAEATSMQETSSSHAMQIKLPIQNEKSQKPNNSEIDLEISNFEQKVQTIDSPKSDVKSELSQRLSSLFRPSKQFQSAAISMQTEIASKPAESDNLPLEESAPQSIEQIENASEPTVLAKEQEVPSEELPQKTQPMQEIQNSAEALDEKTPREMLATSIRRQEVQNMTTEAKLERLHSKLLEMKTALSALSSDSPEASPKSEISKPISSSKPKLEKGNSKSPAKSVQLPAKSSKPKPRPSLAIAKIPQIHAKAFSIPSKSAKISAKSMPKHPAFKKK